VIEQRLPSGETHQRQRGGIGKRDARGRRRQNPGRSHHVLRSRAIACHRQEADDPVADFAVDHALTQRFDRTGDVDAGSVRQRHRDGTLHEAPADVAVDAVERCRGDPDQNLPNAGNGLLDVLVTQDARVAILVETHCLHGKTSSLDIREVLRFRSTNFDV
jgi:hypothetical protein